MFQESSQLINQGTYYQSAEPQRTDCGSFETTVGIDGLDKTAYLKDMKE